MRIHTLGRSLIIGFLATALTSPAIADTVTMKASVRLGPEARVVRLADVAHLVGPLAIAHADLVVASREDVSTLIELDVTDVRRALDQAGVHWGKVDLSGRRTIVRPAPDSLAALPVAMTPASLLETTPRPTRKTRPDDVSSAATLAGERSLRGEVARYALARLHHHPDAVGLRFDPRDDAALATPIGDRRVEIEPLSSLEAEQFQVTVRVWDGGRITDRHLFTGRVLVKTQTLTATRDLARGHLLTVADLEPREQWLAPQLVDAAASRDDAVGRALVKRLQKGDPIRRVDVEREALVHRGDHVMVRCLVGGLVVRMKAEARADAAEGDTVVCRKLGERETFLATVVAAGEVIVDLQR